MASENECVIGCTVGIRADGDNDYYDYYKD
jgi:hypothetical protein